MHPRKNIIEIFSTFMQFAGDRFSNWATESRLRRSIQSCITRTPQETSEYFWVLYWYKFSQVRETQSLAQEHLTAYLQETCYWASQKTVLGLASTQYQISDCFQIAIAKVDKILKNFNPNQGFSLKSYASAIFGSVVRETLRQRHEVDICTDWGLLRKITKKRLVESLQTLGLSPREIEAYVLTWNCFKTLYIPTTTGTSRQLSRPDEEIWNAIAKAYNTQSHQQVNSQTLEKWLLNAAKAVRKYLYPTLASLNTPKGADDSSEWMDNLPGIEESLVNEIIAQEEAETRTSQQTEINQILIGAIAQLEPELQQILQLYYSQELTQDKIAKQLQMQQYTVSRRLKKAQETLLRCLANWSRDKLHISITPDLLKSISTVMEEWLNNYYSSSSH
ncbi:sigma-70 family RNA polymerase sigma factor [Cylindrospermum sp. FACHB-282]|uniref:sigma-70 family RNA polymerase sigma factor n=1 Tax=Cylindrospermum sp. FACHB-282 TaxID=2692794 RepID=UPI0016832F6C|nr:sigma-70 family RNA polymerase sigma factor [Cylindrospermum sp. FACHB-282]MBD2386254.1 sigma-70 family RNA polymerase sigma factor [Cylindrospermum sp. FACHB-282]